MGKENRLCTIDNIGMRYSEIYSYDFSSSDVPDFIKVFEAAKSILYLSLRLDRDNRTLISPDEYILSFQEIHWSSVDLFEYYSSFLRRDVGVCALVPKQFLKKQIPFLTSSCLLDNEIASSSNRIGLAKINQQYRSSYTMPQLLRDVFGE